MKTPRDYQTWAHEATWAYLHGTSVMGPGTVGKNPLIVEATGLGKSLNIAMLIWHLLATYPELRIMQLCHVKELVESNHDELTGMWPSAPAGVYAAGLNRRDTRAQVTFAMINSVAKRAHAFRHVDIVIIDEAHRLSDNDATLYGKFLADLRAVNPRLIVIGYTATDYRMKGGKLTDMGLFDDVVYDIGSGESFIWAVENGYLIRPVPTDPGFQVDDSAIGMLGGDYKDGEASQAMRDQDILERAVDFSIEIARTEGRRCGIAFCQSIDDADLVADMLTYKGYPTEAVHSKMAGDRDAILDAHKRGELWGVTNKDILTTGWNNPMLDLFIGLRLTRSPGLWVQMVGRGTRPCWVNHIGHNGGPPMHDINTLRGRLDSILESGKLNFRVLDFCGNTERLGPINYPNVPSKRKKGPGSGEAPVRKCERHTTKDGDTVGCYPTTFHHTSVKVCPDCGYEFPVQSAFGVKASSSDLVKSKDAVIDLTQQPPPKEFAVFDVHRMICAHHNGRNGKPDTMRVDYFSGLRRFSTWICLAHEPLSFPRRKAEQWWSQHGGGKDAPTDIALATEAAGDLNKPKFIKVWVNTKHPEVVAYDFRGTKFELPPELGGPPLQEPSVDPTQAERERHEAALARVLESTAQYSTSGYDDDIPF